MGLLLVLHALPFAGNGRKDGENSKHFEPLLVVVAMVVILAKHGMLIFALLENVFGTLQWTGGLPPICYADSARPQG